MTVIRPILYCMDMSWILTKLKKLKSTITAAEMKVLRLLVKGEKTEFEMKNLASNQSLRQYGTAFVIYLNGPVYARALSSERPPSVRDDHV